MVGYGDLVLCVCRSCICYDHVLCSCDMPDDDRLLSCPLYCNVPGNDFYDPASQGDPSWGLDI